MEKGINLLTKGLVLVGMSATLMGNQSCQSTPPARVLARRVQLNQIVAPPITLPAAYANQQFDFQYVANQQMATVLTSTQSFSTANIDPSMTYTPAGLASLITNDFNDCSSTSNAYVPPTIIAPIGGGMPQVMTKSNSCVINLPQAVISGSINDFSLVGGGGINLSLTSGILPALSFNMQAYNMQIEMNAIYPLDQGKNNFVSVIQNQGGYGGSLSATIDFGALAVGPSGYYNTPLSTISLNGLTAATTDLATAWSAQDPWYTNVLKACGTYIYINGSTDLGLEVGDILAVTNVTYEWNGTPCESTSMGNVPDVTPVSYVQIVSTGTDIATAQILKGNSTYPQQNDTIYPGARVTMYQTAETVKSLQTVTGATGGVCQLPVGSCTPASN